MPQAKLTKRFVESLEYVTKGQSIYTDTELAGFGLIVGAKSKTYYAQREVNRKTVRVTIGKHGTFTTEQARADAKELLVRMARGENPNETKRQNSQETLTFAEALDSYEIERKGLSESTKYKIKRCRDAWLSDWLNKPISKITKEMVLKKHTEITKKHGGATANQAIWIFRAAYNMALSTNESLPSNPTLALSQTKNWYPQERRSSFIKPTQLKAWYEAVSLLDNSCVRDFLCLLLFTGMRRSEGLSLEWKNIDFNEKTILVPDTKNGKPLTLPMSDYIYSLLKQRKRRTGDSNWVFPSTGKTGHLIEPKRTVADIVKKSGVRFMLHDLRRTFITVAESLDISAYSLKSLINHTQNGDVTAGYIIVTPERLREPMQKITDAILEKIEINQSEDE